MSNLHETLLEKIIDFSQHMKRRSPAKFLMPMGLIGCNNQKIALDLHKKPIILFLHNSHSRGSTYYEGTYGGNDLFGIYEIASLWAYLPNESNTEDVWQNLLETNDFYFRVRGTLVNFVVPEGCGIPELRFFFTLAQPAMKAILETRAPMKEDHSWVANIDEERRSLHSILGRIGKKSQRRKDVDELIHSHGLLHQMKISEKMLRDNLHVMSQSEIAATKLTIESIRDRLLS